MYYRVTQLVRSLTDNLTPKDVAESRLPAQIGSKIYGMVCESGSAEWVCIRCAIERAVVRKLIQTMQADGWQPVLKTYFTDREEGECELQHLVDNVVSVEELTLNFKKDGTKYGVVLVFGNAGIDCINDYSDFANFGDLVESVVDWADQFDMTRWPAARLTS